MAQVVSDTPAQPTASPAVTPLDLRRAAGQFATGVTVVTVRDGDGFRGMTANSFTSVSLDPPLVLVSVDRRSETQAGFRASGAFAVSVLAEGQEELSRRFAASGHEKFADLATSLGALGLPLVPNALAHIECRVVAAHEAGDHTLYVGEIVSLAVRPGRPLLYHQGLYRRLDPQGGPPGAGAGSHTAPGSGIKTRSD